MSKSNTYNRLHRLFTSNHKTSTSFVPKQTHKITPIDDQKTPTNDAEITRQTMNERIRDLLGEKNPQNLLEKFTDISKSSSFRNQCRHIYELTIHRLALSKQYNLIEKALESQKKYISGEGFACRIIHLYGKSGMFDHAYKVFDEMPERNFTRGPKCLSTLMGAAANSGHFDKVYRIFREVPGETGIVPNAASYDTAAHALCKLGLFEDAVSLLDEMVANGLKPGVVSFNTLLGAFYGKGDFEEGERMWERMIKSGVVPDVCSYDSKLQALVNEGKVAEAIELVKELRSKGLKPGVGTYNALIQGFVKVDDLDKAKRLYKDLIQSSCAPNKNTFGVLVPFACEKGDYGFAFEVSKQMFKRQCSVDEAALQNVIDVLAKNAMIEEAKTLLELGRSNAYFPYNLVMPNMV